jgi:hypothetical protein
MGVRVKAKPGLLGGGMFVSVPLDLDARSTEPANRRNDDVSAIPRMNAVRMCSLDEIDSPRRFPNLAVIRFAEAHENVRDHIKRIGGDHAKGTPGNRAIIDLPAMMLPWLAFIWGTSGSANPLLSGTGLLIAFVGLLLTLVLTGTLRPRAQVQVVDNGQGHLRSVELGHGDRAVQRDDR